MWLLAAAACTGSVACKDPTPKTPVYRTAAEGTYVHYVTKDIHLASKTDRPVGCAFKRAFNLDKVCTIPRDAVCVTPKDPAMTLPAPWVTRIEPEFINDTLETTVEWATKGHWVCAVSVECAPEQDACADPAAILTPDRQCCRSVAPAGG